MNAKRAKALRRAARELTVGLREREVEFSPTGASVNKPHTTRGTVRALKRGARR